MVEIFWTAESKKWLKKIYDYISLDSPNNARKVIDDIVERTDVIKDFPLCGQKLIEWTENDVRMLLYGSYRIVYLIKSETKVDILGVYHRALDLKQHLKIKRQ